MNKLRKGLGYLLIMSLLLVHMSMGMGMQSMAAVRGRKDSDIVHKSASKENYKVQVSFRRDTFPEDVKLKLTKITKTKLQEDRDMIQSQLPEGMNILSMEGIDISFQGKESKEILEPEGEVTVQLKLKKPMEKTGRKASASDVAPERKSSASNIASPSDIAGSSNMLTVQKASASDIADSKAVETQGWMLFHVTEDEDIQILSEEESTEITENSREAVQKLDFTLDSFSPVYIVLVEGMEPQKKETKGYGIRTAEELSEAVYAGGVGVLAADIEIPAGKGGFATRAANATGFTLYMNGHNITREKQDGNQEIFYVPKGITLEIADSIPEDAAIQLDWEKYTASPSDISDGFPARGEAEIPTITNHSGHAIRTENETTVKLQDISFEGNHAPRAVQTGARGTLEIRNCVFHDNGNEGDWGGAIQIGEETSVSIRDSLFTNNTGSRGGAIYFANSMVRDFTGNRFRENTATLGGALYLSKSSLILTGEEGKENQILKNTAKENGGGIFAHDSEILMEGGIIEENQSSRVNVSWGNGGAGVRTEGKSRFVLSGGSISRNVSHAGGGGLSLQGTFSMTGGEVNENTAWNGEGGGIAIFMCTAEINGGKIRDNASGYHALTKEANADYPHWGGGGIFISDQPSTETNEISSLTLRGALITQNHADGFGGGVAGCATGAVFLFGDGASIFDNTVLQTADREEKAAHMSGAESSKNQDRTFGLENDDFWRLFGETGYQDFFCALNSVVKNTMPGGNAGWEGSVDYRYVNLQDADGQELLIGNTMTALTAHPDEGVARTGTVEISGNTSYTHGGGILCNGNLFIGTALPASVEVGDRMEVKAKKALSADSALTELPAGFTFSLYEEKNGEKQLIAEGSNDASGVIRFNNALVFRESGSYTYYMEEKPEQDLSEILGDLAEKLLWEKNTEKYRLTVQVEDQIQTISAMQNGQKVSVDQIWHRIQSVQADRLTEEGWEAAEALHSDLDSDPHDIHHYGWLVLGDADSPAFTNVLREKPEEPTEPAEEPTQPAEEPTEPAEEPTQPVEEPTEPAEEPTSPAEEPTQPTRRSAGGSGGGSSTTVRRAVTPTADSGETGPVSLVERVLGVVRPETESTGEDPAADPQAEKQAVLGADRSVATGDPDRAGWYGLGTLTMLILLWVYEKRRRAS